MKRIFIFLLAAVVLCASVSLAEDLSSLSDAELLLLYGQVLEEMEIRNLPPEPSLPAIDDDPGRPERDIAERLEAFFRSWAASDTEGMLTVCSSDWISENEDSDTELLRILAHRKPLEYTLMSVSGEAEAPVRTAEVIVTFDRNNGKEPARYLLRIVMEEEDDELWYVDPTSLLAQEKAEDVPAAEQTPEPVEEDPELSDSTVLYYAPEGGQYYHVDRNCRRVHKNFLPLSGVFTYAELENGEFKDLQPCEICGAPAR